MKQLFQCVHTLPQIDIPWQDPAAWSHVLSLTKSGSAAGACGWRFEELKILPPSALRHLISLYGRVLDCGEFPEPFTRARVSLFGKTDNPRYTTDARPVTIIGCIVRLFTKFSAFFILRTWTSFFPAAISGGLPGRGVRVFSWLQQFAAEVANIKKTPVAGLSLDLVKAFNLLPRIPLGQLMEHLNVPSNLVAVWDNKFPLFLGFQKDVLFLFVQCWLLAFCIITMHPRPPPRPLHMWITSTSLHTPQHNGPPLLKLLEFLWTYGLCRLTGGKLGCGLMPHI